MVRNKRKKRSLNAYIYKVYQRQMQRLPKGEKVQKHSYELNTTQFYLVYFYIFLIKFSNTFHA